MDFDTNYFPEFNDHQDVAVKTKYLEKRLIDLINGEHGPFYLSPLIAYPERNIRDFIGHIIFDQEFDAKERRLLPDRGTDEIINETRVKLESIRWDDKKQEYAKTKDLIIFKKGVKKSDGAGGAPGLRGANIGGFFKNGLVDNFVEKKSEFDADLKTAWMILNEQGELVRPCVRVSQQHTEWKVREVVPREIKTNG